MKIWEPKSPEILWATPGLLRHSFTFTLTGNNLMRRVHSQPYSCSQDIPCFTEITSAVLVSIYWFQSTPALFSAYIHSHINLHIASDVFALGFLTIFCFFPLSMRAACPAHVMSSA